MTEILTATQTRAIEAAAIASGAVTGLQLMERAGQGVIDAIFAQWPELAKTDQRAVVLCGPGNNGGDGFVAARVLKEWGWEVDVFLYGAPETLPPDAKVIYARWLAMGDVGALTAQTWDNTNFPGPYALLIDALFGIGLSRSVDLPLFAVRPVSQSAGHAYKVVAIDIPSGLCANTGRVVGRECVAADMTVTFHSAKAGHILADGPEFCGELRVIDLGLPQPNWSDRLQPVAVQTIEKTVGLGKLSGHKYRHGHALILAGGVGHGGAARLAARGALRIGAGLVTVACPPAAMIENAARLDAVMLRAVQDGAGLAQILTDARINALCIGPGLGVDRAAQMLGVVLADAAVNPRPTVIDADGLTALAQNPRLFEMLHKDCVLTPHGGEFARMFPDIAAKLAAPVTTGAGYSKVDAVRTAAQRAGCVVLFKGADTVIADPDGNISVNAAVYDRAAPWLATAGSGDVLAGFITGLLARGFSAMQSAETGAWLHVSCALSFGPGLIAEDLPEAVPAVFRGLGL